MAAIRSGGLPEVHPDGPDQDRIRWLVGTFAEPPEAGLPVTTLVLDRERLTGLRSDPC